MQTYLERVKDREKELTGLRTRQDGDNGLRNLAQYVMRYAEPKDKKIPDIVNVTLNRPAVLAANVISALGKTSEQIVVETEDKKLDTAYIERFQRACFASANARLRKQGLFQLNPFFDEQTCIRGGGAARCLFRMEDGILIPDITQWDFRYVTWENGDDGLDYAAYNTIQTQAMIDKQAWAKGLNLKLSSSKGKVLDVWDNEHNEIWVDERKVFEQAHTYGFTPVALAIVPLGSMLADADSIERGGESIFFLIRTVIPELNRLVSIMQTLNLKAVKPPIKQKKIGGGAVTPYDDVMGSGAATVMEPTEDIQLIDYGDAQRSAQIAYAAFNQALAEGSLPPEAFGSINLDLSNVALITLGERAGQVFLPRLDTKALLNQELADMFTRQCLQIGGSLEIGTIGHKATFDMGKIDGTYQTTFKYNARSPQVDMARFSMAASAGNLIPDRAKREEILMRENPDEDERMLRWEAAEMLSPTIRLYRTIRSLQEETPKLGDGYGDREAELLTQEMGINIKQMLAGEIGQRPQVEERQKPKLLPGLTEAGEPSSAKKAAQLKATPEQMGGE